MFCLETGGLLWMWFWFDLSCVYLDNKEKNCDVICLRVFLVGFRYLHIFELYIDRKSLLSFFLLTPRHSLVFTDRYMCPLYFFCSDVLAKSWKCYTQQITKEEVIHSIIYKNTSHNIYFGLSNRNITNFLYLSYNYLSLTIVSSSFEQFFLMKSITYFLSCNYVKVEIYVRQSF